MLFANWGEEQQRMLGQVVVLGRAAIAAEGTSKRAQHNPRGRTIAEAFEELDEDGEQDLPGRYRAAVRIADNRRAQRQLFDEDALFAVDDLSQALSDLADTLPQKSDLQLDLMAARRYMYTPDPEGPHSWWGRDRLLERLVGFLDNLQDEGYRRDRAELFAAWARIREVYEQRQGKKLYVRFYGSPNPELRHLVGQYADYLRVDAGVGLSDL